MKYGQYSKAIEPALFVIAAFLAVSSMFMGLSAGVWQVLSTVFVLLLVAVILSYINSNALLFAPRAMLLCGVFFVTALAFPEGMCLGRYHFCAFSMPLSLHFWMRYVSSEQVRPDLPLLILLPVSVAALIEPPMAWMVLLFFLSSLAARHCSLTKFLLASVAGISLPWLYVFASDYVFSWPDAAGIYGNFIRSLFAGPSPLPLDNAGGVVYVAVFVILVIRASLFTVAGCLKDRRERKVIICFTAFLAVASLPLWLYYYGAGAGNIMFSPMYAIVFFDYFANASRAESLISFSVFSMAVLFLRIFSLTL